MDKTNRYEVGKIWLVVFGLIGVLLLGASLIDFLSRSFSLSNIPTAFMGFIFLYQYWSFRRMGYVNLGDELLTVNLGIAKKRIKLAEIEEIKKSNNTYFFHLVDGRRLSIGMSFVSAKDRVRLATELERISASKNRENINS